VKHIEEEDVQQGCERVPLADRCADIKGVSQAVPSDHGATGAHQARADVLNRGGREAVPVESSADRVKLYRVVRLLHIITWRAPPRSRLRERKSSKTSSAVCTHCETSPLDRNALCATCRSSGFASRIAETREAMIREGILPISDSSVISLISLISSTSGRPESLPFGTNLIRPRVTCSVWTPRPKAHVVRSEGNSCAGHSPFPVSTHRRGHVGQEAAVRGETQEVNGEPIMTS